MVYRIDPPDAEYIDRERQPPADVRDTSGLVAQRAAQDLAVTREGEPRQLYDVRCVYDSRPPNGYDFNLSVSQAGSLETNNVIAFQVPTGYRAVPREWRVGFEPIPFVTLDAMSVFLQANGADIPNNVSFIGEGTTFPIKSFFVVEENSIFGCRVVDAGTVITGNIIVQIYGNLLPVTGVALPFEVTNRKP